MEEKRAEMRISKLVKRAIALENSLVSINLALGALYETNRIYLTERHWCQDKIPTAKILNVTKYPEYTQCFILTLKLSEQFLA